MKRNFPDWIKAYQQYTASSEAPKRMHFFAAVSAIAGALRKKVWFDMGDFRWTPNFFIIFVAPPGIIAKSTTAGLSMGMLREVPGIKFGPDIVTWPALVTAFAAAGEGFEFEGDIYPMSAITIEASELGNFLNPQDREMVNLCIELWDGRKKLDKITKTAGNDVVESPWINMIGCTTPHWIADNMPTATVGGGFTSRCIFVYADEKERLVAYPFTEHVAGRAEFRLRLIQDLEHISSALCGPYVLTPEALEWGQSWYASLWTDKDLNWDDERFAVYRARKQTHLHKLALVLAASCRDERVITKDDLIIADLMLKDTEQDLGKVFARIGKSIASMEVDRFLAFIKSRKIVEFSTAYGYIHSAFPDYREFEGMLAGATHQGAPSST